MPWKESKTLAGEIGEYIVTMRQASDGTYLVAAATNEKERLLQIPMSFLPQGTFVAEVIEDGDTAHYLTNRETYKVMKENITKKDILNVRLAAGGGSCIKLVMKK